MRNPMLNYRATSALLILVLVANVSSAAVLEEIVVTATKREQNVQDVGIAITAMTGDQMEALGFTAHRRRAR